MYDFGIPALRSTAYDYYLYLENDFNSINYNQPEVGLSLVSHSLTRMHS